ncbi:MAG: phosphodiester glycosidase family protein, partial [Stackebrandtia sp.]
GKASRVDDSAGSGPIAENAQIVIGRDAGADALSDVAVGDPVEVDYKLAGEGDAIDVAVGGNVVILRDGEVVAPDNPLHPRTAAGVDAAGTTLYLAVVDGRSSLSVGMNYVDLAELMKSFGADDAINLDGGGSTTMAVHNGEAPTVVNQPSDGQQRSVPNGIGFASTAACPLVDRDFAAYPDLAADAEGPEVRGAQCLLGDAGFRPADAEPTGVIDPDTAAQVEALQTDRGLEATGEIDPATWTALLSSGATPTLQNGDRGSAVIRLQRTLTAALGQELPIDGIFGDDVEAAVRDYQSSRGLGVDGVAGAETWEAMQAGS